MNNQLTESESLQPVLEGFRRITKREQAEYLKYLALVIQRQKGNEKRRFIRFKAKLEREIKNSEEQKIQAR